MESGAKWHKERAHDGREEYPVFDILFITAVKQTRFALVDFGPKYKVRTDNPDERR